MISARAASVFIKELLSPLLHSLILLPSIIFYDKDTRSVTDLTNAPL